MIVKVSKKKKLTNSELAAIFKALSDENRLAIFRLLRNCCGPECEMSEEEAGSYVSEIAHGFDISLSTVSHHLKELRQAGLIVCEKQGKHVCCRPNYQVIERIGSFLSEEP